MIEAVHDHNKLWSQNIKQSTIDMLITAPLQISENNNDDERQYVRNKDVLCPRGGRRHQRLGLTGKIT